MQDNPSTERAPVQTDDAEMLEQSNICSGYGARTTNAHRPGMALSAVAGELDRYRACRDELTLRVMEARSAGTTTDALQQIGVPQEVLAAAAIDRAEHLAAELEQLLAKAGARP